MKGNWIGWAISLAVLGVFFAGSVELNRQNSRDERERLPKLGVLRLTSLNAATDRPGWTEDFRRELLGELSMGSGFRVTSTELTISGNRLPEDWKSLARKAQVDAILDGSIKRTTNGIRVNLQIISGEDGFILWAATLEDSAAGRLASAIRQKLSAWQDARVHGPGQTRHKKEAIEAYLAAFSEPFGPGRPDPNSKVDPMERALRRRDRLEAAVQAEPTFAQAVAALAQAELSVSDFRRPGWLETTQHAKQLASKALELDDSIAAAHGVLGTIALLREFRPVPAAMHLERAIELDPRNEQWQHLYGASLSLTGRFEEALDQIARIEAGIGADEPPAAAPRIARAEVYFQWHKFAQAEAEAREALSRQPQSVAAHWALAVSLQFQDRLEEAEKELRAALAIEPHDPRATIALGCLLQQMGRKTEADAWWQQADQHWAAWGGLGNTSNAMYLSAQGLRAQAVERLRAARQAVEASFPFMLTDPRLALLAGDPGYDALARTLREAK